MARTRQNQHQQQTPKVSRKPGQVHWSRPDDWFVVIPIIGFATVGRDKQSSATPLPGACMTPYSGSADVDAVTTAFVLAATRRFG